MSKISKATFASLANIFLKFFNKQFEKHDWTNQGEDRKKAEKLIDLTYFYIKEETPFALAAGLWLAEIWLEEISEAERKQKFPELDNQTIGKFIERIKQALKNHCEASGYVKNDSFASIQKKQREIKVLYDNEEYRNKLLLYFSEEDKKVVLGAVLYMQKTDDVFPKARISNERYEEYSFVMEDIIGRVEQAKAKLEKIEQVKQKTDSSPSSNQKEQNSTPTSTENQPAQANNSPSNSEPNLNSTNQSVNSPVASNKQEIENLEKEKTRLEEKLKQLSGELANNQNASEKKIKEEILATTRQLIQEKEEQLKKMGANLPKEQSTKNEKDWKINLAIGLGITAVVLLLLLVIVNISRKRKD